MDFEEYQKRSRKTAIYPGKGNNFVYPTLGIAGEAGEVSEKVKKMVRGDGGYTPGEKKEEIAKELGDILWYIAQLATELDISLDQVATSNIKKVESRKKRKKLKGDGDNR
jgi:NTP pyrophosphatase (non-canonical NTP hydrolase)